MDELLKRKEELLKAKLEIEKKLKRASNLKSSNSEKLTSIAEEEAALFVDLQFDRKSGTLAVLQPGRLILKNLVDPVDECRFIDLPDEFKADSMIFESETVVVSSESSQKISVLSSDQEWSLFSIDEGFKVIKMLRLDDSVGFLLFVSYSDKLKEIKLFKGVDDVIKLLSDVEAVFTSKESFETVLLLKSDSLLIV